MKLHCKYTALNVYPNSWSCITEQSLMSNMSFDKESVYTGSSIVTNALHYCKNNNRGSCDEGERCMKILYFLLKFSINQHLLINSNIKFTKKIG